MYTSPSFRRAEERFMSFVNLIAKASRLSLNARRYIIRVYSVYKLLKCGLQRLIEGFISGDRVRVSVLGVIS